MSQPASSPHHHHHHLSPPPDLPSSSKLLIPSLPFPDLPEDDASPPAAPRTPPCAECDHAPLWECVVNGIGGCEALEAELRECQAKLQPKPKQPDNVGSGQCDYAPLWECIVNGNGGCEVLEDELRSCLEKSSRN